MDAIVGPPAWCMCVVKFYYSILVLALVSMWTRQGSRWRLLSEGNLHDRLNFNTHSRCALLQSY